MSNVLSTLKEALGAGARASKYQVKFSFPSIVGASVDTRDIDTLCKATSFPAMTIGQIEVFNQGRKMVLPGDTSFTNTWTLTFLNTEAHNIRRDMVKWMASADHFQNNMHSGSPNSVLGELGISQLDSAGNVTATYTFHNVFPQEVGEITIGADQVDTMQEFDVTFSFTDWVVGDGEMQNPDSANAATENESALS